MSNKPKHFFVLKIVGLAGFAVAITGIVLLVRGFGDFESNNFMIGGMMMAFGFMAGMVGTVTGFRPEIAKARTRTARYIQEQNKADLTAIANNTAEIVSDAVATTAEAVRGDTRKTMFCKHCGARIDSDSKFCSSCGKEQ